MKDIWPGPMHGAFATYLLAAGGKVYFNGIDGNQAGLWVSDGTEEGTFLVKEFVFGAFFSRQAVSVNDVLYFTAPDSRMGSELWKTDGTIAGTTLVKDIRAGGFGANPRSLFNAGGTLFFVASDGIHGPELWTSDGSSAGTRIVKDIHAGPGDNSPDHFANVDGTLFFRIASTQVWKSDGTAEGTILVKEFPQHLNGLGIDGFTAIGSHLYFRAYGDVGEELWRSDGTPLGTQPANDIAAGTGGSRARILAQTEDRLFAVGVSEQFGQEVWVANLTPDVLGDFDVDADVDGADILKWQRQVGDSPTPAGSRADADGSGVVGSGDLGLWKANFGAGAGISAALTHAPDHPSLALREDYRLRSGDFGSTVLVGPVPIQGRGPEGLITRDAAADAVYAAGDFSQLFAEARGYRPPRRERAWR